MSLVSSNQPHSPLGPSQLRRVHIITDRFSMVNTYLIAEERLVVVDPCSELIIDQLHGYLQQVLRRAIADIDLIVLTHLRFDLTAVLKILRCRCNAPVVASSVIQQLANFQREKNAYPESDHIMQNVLPATSSQLDLLPLDYQHQVKLIDLWLDDGDVLPHCPDWRVIASPAPTPESLCLYNPFTWELLCGDTMVIRSGTPLLRSGTNRYQIEETRRILHNLQVHYLYPTYGRCMLGLHPLNNISLE